MRISDWSSDVCSSDLFVEHLFGATIRAVNLVNDYNRLQAQRQRLASYELGLRHCAFRTVDKQDNPVNHGEDALNLTAEIGVAGRIRSEEHTSELQSLMRISYAVFCLKKKKHTTGNQSLVITSNVNST